MKPVSAYDNSAQTNTGAARAGLFSTIVRAAFSSLSSLLEPGFDPTQLSEAQRRDAGIAETETAWFKARNEPLIK